VSKFYRSESLVISLIKCGSSESTISELWRGPGLLPGIEGRGRLREDQAEYPLEETHHCHLVEGLDLRFNPQEETEEGVDPHGGTGETPDLPLGGNEADLPEGIARIQGHQSGGAVPHDEIEEIGPSHP